MVEAAVTPTATLLGRIAATQNCEWLRHSVAIARYRAAPLNQVLYVQMSTAAKKTKKAFSWHFWLLHSLTCIAPLLGYAIGEKNDTRIESMVILGLIIYASPAFLCLIRNFTPNL